MSARMLTVEDVADQLRCSEWSVYRLIASGELVAAKVAGRWLVSQVALDVYLDQKAQATSPAAASTRMRRRRRSA